MEATKEGIEKLEQSMSERREILTDEECDKMADLIGLDLDDAQDFQTFHVNDDFTECEAIALYPDYMVVRQKTSFKNKMLCESMAIEVEHKNTLDISASILRDSITSICIQRELSCDCEDCLTEIAKGKKKKQSEDYYIHIASGNRPYSFFVGDCNEARFYQEHLMNWRLQKDVFKYKKGVYHKGNK